MNRIIFAIGSNLGDRKAFLEEAVSELKLGLNLKNVKVSTILQNKALLLEGAPPEWNIDFFNIALSGDIDLHRYEPLKILEIIKNLEVKIGRIDRGKWSPREIDIDILAIDNLVFDYGNKLQIPHLELFNRDFFINKFIEIEPEIFEQLKENARISIKQ